MIHVQDFSSTYFVKKLTIKDVPFILDLEKTNPDYYQYVPPFPSKESLLKDMKELPPKATAKDKFYIGFYKKEQLIAILDLVLNYPNPHTFFISFFMIHKKYQNNGIGSQIIQEILSRMPSQYTEAYLGIVEKNESAQKFWIKNGFEFTGKKYRHPLYTIQMMSKKRT